MSHCPHHDHDHECEPFPLEERLVELEAASERYGHAITGDMHREVPIFHTVGLAKRNLPEIVLSARMNPLLCTALLNHLVAYFDKNGFKTGRIDDVFCNKQGKELPCFIRPIHVDRATLENSFEILNYIHRDKTDLELSEVTIVQLIWSDENGVLAIEEGFECHDGIEILPERVLS
ncbi:DUF4262 domain-containing protein [Shewanella glacialipiscicola]|uniref:DUF4262 domain-containing protein n=1 Tax=Shewanella glacialipiscicola TaxID=614069 RepID=UPI003D7AFD98